MNLLVSCIVWALLGSLLACEAPKVEQKSELQTLGRALELQVGAANQHKARRLAQLTRLSCRHFCRHLLQCTQGHRLHAETVSQLKSIQSAASQSSLPELRAKEIAFELNRAQSHLAQARDAIQACVSRQTELELEWLR